MSEEDNDDKQHEPTAKKLEDARKKGEVAKSADITAAAGLLGFFLTLIVLGPTILSDLSMFMTFFFDVRMWASTTGLDGSGPWHLGIFVVSVGPSMAALFGVPAACILLAVVAQQSFIFSVERITPKLSKISPISNAKQKFGRQGLFEFGKSAVKLSFISVVLWLFLLRNFDPIVQTIFQTPHMIMVVLADLSLDFLLLATLLMMGIGGVDFLWQQAEHLRKNRMSHKELMDETKEAEGDPHMKGQRRQRAYDIATNQMLADVPSADVIVVNPTHYAVALKWDRASGRAPICVAKGVDEIAARIRELANENGVPIQSDPPTARALHASVEIGDEIPRDHYRAVAAAIRFAEKIRSRVRTGH